MNRQSCITFMVVAGCVFGGISGVRAGEGADQLLNEANESIALAAEAIEEARAAIENGKQLIGMIPSNSVMIVEVADMLQAASDNWGLSVVALEGAKQSASKISSAVTPGIAQDYKLLATVNAGVALSGAKVVQTGLLFVDAVAHDKTESLDIIRLAMRDSLVASSQVQFNYERVKSLIAKKYSK